MMTDRERLIGTWRLVAQYTDYPDGRRVETRGPNPVGIIMYDALGNMSVQLMRTDDRAGDYYDLRELATGLEGYHAYFGTYTVDETAQTVTHHIVGAAYPGYRGSDQVRHYAFDGDQLTLTVLATGDDTQRVIVWERLHTTLT